MSIVIGEFTKPLQHEIYALSLLGPLYLTYNFVQTQTARLNIRALENDVLLWTYY